MILNDFTNYFLPLIIVGCSLIIFGLLPMYYNFISYRSHHLEKFGLKWMYLGIAMNYLAVILIGLI